MFQTNETHSPTTSRLFSHFQSKLSTQRGYPLPPLCDPCPKFHPCRKWILGKPLNIHHAMTPFPCHVFLPTIRVGRSAKISLWHPLTCWAHPAQCCPQVSLRSSRAIPAWAILIAPRHPFPASKGGRPKFGLETLETTKQIPDTS